MIGMPIWYPSDMQSYCRYCCTITVHEIEEIVEHQFIHGICLPYICSYLLSRQSLCSDPVTGVTTGRLRRCSGRNLSTEKSSFALNCGWVQTSFCVRPAWEVDRVCTCANIGSSGNPTRHPLATHCARARGITGVPEADPHRRTGISLDQLMSSGTW